MVLYTFTSYNSCLDLLNNEVSNLMFLKNHEFDNIIITFTYQNGRSLEIEDEVNLTLLFSKWK